MSTEQGNEQHMTWQERQAAVSQVMKCLEGIDTKDDYRSDVLLGVLAAAAQLVLPPGCRVDLVYRMSRNV